MGVTARWARVLAAGEVGADGAAGAGANSAGSVAGDESTFEAVVDGVGSAEYSAGVEF